MRNLQHQRPADHLADITVPAFVAASLHPCDWRFLSGRDTSDGGALTSAGMAAGPGVGRAAVVPGSCGGERVNRRSALEVELGWFGRRLCAGWAVEALFFSVFACRFLVVGRNIASRFELFNLLYFRVEFGLVEVATESLGANARLGALGALVFTLACAACT